MCVAYYYYVYCGKRLFGLLVVMKRRDNFDVFKRKMCKFECFAASLHTVLLVFAINVYRS